MNAEVLRETVKVAKELRFSLGNVQPGLRSRLNEVRSALVAHWNQGNQRVESGKRQTKDRKGNLKPTKEKLYKWIRSNDPESEAVERLIALVASACYPKPPRELIRGSGIAWNAVACADAILDQCKAIESIQVTEAPIGYSMDDIIARKFWKCHRAKGSQNDRADAVAASVTDEEYAAFGRSKKAKRDYFYRLIQLCDGTNAPKWLENRK